MGNYFSVAQIILGVALIAIILLQVRNSGAASVFGGQDTSIYRTRRGVERTLFIATIALSVIFFVIALFNAVIVSPPTG